MYKKLVKGNVYTFYLSLITWCVVCVCVRAAAM